MTSAAEKLALQQTGLYDPSQEHDACGVGFVAHIKGAKTHAIVTQALKILENLDHRGAVGADKLMGDGAGILIQLPDALYREEMAKQGVTLPSQGEYGVGMVLRLGAQAVCHSQNSQRRYSKPRFEAQQRVLHSQHV